MIGGGLGPLTVGMLSDALTPRFGAEALRWSLMAVMFTFALAALSFAWALKSYAKAVATPR
jgi:hypothetical protein